MFTEGMIQYFWRCNDCGKIETECYKILGGNDIPKPTLPDAWTQIVNGHSQEFLCGVCSKKLAAARRFLRESKKEKSKGGGGLNAKKK
jgi:hypothetical protein